jgi:hypothetical protein
MHKGWHTATKPLNSKIGTSRYLKSFLRGVMILAPHLDLGETSRQPAQPEGVRAIFRESKNLRVLN